MKQDEFDYGNLVGKPTEIKGESGSTFGDCLTALSILIIIGAIAFELGWRVSTAQ